MLFIASQRVNMRGGSSTAGGHFWVSLVCTWSLLVCTFAGRDRGPHAPTPDALQPSAWAWISSRPELSLAAQVLTLIDAEQALSGPFTGTLLLPTNEALTAYLNETQAPVDISGTTAYQSFWRLFFTKLFSYHVLLRRVYGSQSEHQVPYSTNYTSINATPHKVKFVTNSTCMPLHPTHGKGAQPGVPCPTSFVVDEQGNDVTFALGHTTVQGGGVIYTINAVLQPNDIFPSLAAALSSSDFSTLKTIIKLIDAGLNITLLPDLEKTPGTLAVPDNQAFAGINPANFSASTLLSIVTYHFCGPVTASYRLLYTPFKYPSGRNPCLTLLGRTSGTKSLALAYRGYSNGVARPPTLWINYPTGNAASTVNGTAPISTADITVPLHVTHVITKLLIPPL